MMQIEVELFMIKSAQWCRVKGEKKIMKRKK